MYNNNISSGKHTIGKSLFLLSLALARAQSKSFRFATIKLHFTPALPVDYRTTLSILDIDLSNSYFVIWSLKKKHLRTTLRIADCKDTRYRSITPYRAVERDSQNIFLQRAGITSFRGNRKSGRLDVAIWSLRIAGHVIQDIDAIMLF